MDQLSTLTPVKPYPSTPAAHIPAGTFTMAQPNSKSNLDASENEHDPLFNLKHAQAEAELAQHTNGLGPITNEYVTSDEDGEIDEGPRDSQGFRRGENPTNVNGTSAGDHK
ncbi:hypothetical protein IC235_09975 [Hymenobacter sp. BT664]|uniref:Uncharacterized protein n=1 Tax=Hymenobacter montanus TaxID=2771359 RepID=A0A927GJJ7_9BACT|nr:hypothetical protein [Hymenobacter montanus]MBD2768219.1 hypothetical protein [Hymenobacter montanus]